jgi:hypothetical protein
VRFTTAVPASELSACARIARAAGLDDGASSQPPKQSGFADGRWLRGREEGSGCKRAIRARGVRAADLQEEPTKPTENKAHPQVSHFRRVRRRQRLPGTIAASGASHQTQRAQRAERATRHSERSNQTRRITCGSRFLKREAQAGSFGLREGQ